MHPEQKLFCILNGFLPTGVCERGNKDMSDKQILPSREDFLSLWLRNSNELLRSVNIGHTILRTWLYNPLHVHIYTMATWELWLHSGRVYRWMIWLFIYSMHYRWRYLLPFLSPTSETRLGKMDILHYSLLACTHEVFLIETIQHVSGVGFT